jgi:4-amino-4-deoxy-L-arabinose transferase-like glycosyltransferase
MFLKNQTYFPLLIILLLAFFLRISATLADPFLHPWDERFHALVSRNLIDNPWIPILRVNPVTDNFDKFSWCCNHVWLHKQPLFMWQMALSMKIFGVSEWSMRLPSALMGTLMILVVYRIAKLLKFKERVALFAALLLACSNFHLNMIAGIRGMDHNDVAHGFYILLSIWCLLEYIASPKKYWVVLIGVFAGAAILNKWLTGLLVYLIWGTYLLSNFIKGIREKRDWVMMILSLLVCCVVFIPWQIYIMNRFPELAAHEYEFNRKHIFEALEGHSGTTYFYLQHLSQIFGNILYLLIPIGFVLSWRERMRISQVTFFIILGILFVFMFFSLIVKTKVVTYLFFIAPLAMIFIAMVLDSIIEIMRKYIHVKLLPSVCVFVILYCSLNPQAIIKYFSSENLERENRIYNAKIYKEVKKMIPPDCYLVMNMNSFEDIDVMFYNDNITAYHWTLSPQDFELLKEKKIKVAVFKNHGNYTLPEHVVSYPYLYIIDKELKNF